MPVPNNIQIMHLGPVQIWLCPRQMQPDLATLRSLLPPAELITAERFRAKERYQEFLVGRWLFHLSTGRPEAVGRDAQGCPEWPADICGAITHKSGHVAFAWQERTQVFGLGIDLEDLGLVKDSFEKRICLDSEVALLEELLTKAPEWRRSDCLGLIFSAKESLFKAHFPQGREYFYFDDAELVEIDLVAQSFWGRLKRQTSSATSAGHIFKGYFQSLKIVDSSLIVTAVCEPSISTLQLSL